MAHATLQEVLDTRDYLKNYYSGMHTRFAMVDDFYRGIYTIPLSKGAEPYKPATAKKKVDYATDVAMTVGARVIVPEWSQSEAVSKLCGKLQRFGQAFIETPDFVKVKRDVLKHGTMYGMMCRQGPMYIQEKFPHKPKTMGLSPEEKKRAWDEYEARRFQAIPFESYAVNPQSIFPDPSNVSNPPCVVKIVMRKAGLLRALYPDVEELNKDAYKGDAVVEWTEWWTEDQYCYLIKDEPVDGGIKENWMGVIPFDIGYGGLGWEAADGEPAERAIGLIYHSMSAFVAEAAMKTSVLDYIVNFFRGRERIVRPAGSDLQLGGSMGMDVIPDDYNYTVDRPPPMNEGTLSAIQMVEADIEKQTHSAVMEGRNPVGAAPTSGYDRSLMNAADRINLAGTIQSYEVMEASGLNKTAIQIRDCIKEPVTMLGFKADGTVQETVKPSDIGYHSIYRVKLDGKSPEEISQRMMMGKDLWSSVDPQTGLRPISWHTLQKDFMGQDPDQERVWQLGEMVYGDPATRQAMVEFAARVLGINRQTQMANDVAQIRQKQQRQNPLEVPQGEGMRTQQLLGTMGRPAPLNTPEEQEAPV